MINTATAKSPRPAFPWPALGVLLIAAVAILSHADELGLWFDELWTVFHSSARLGQILAERDVTWPFGYFAVLHAWGRFASWNDFVLHVLGAFFGLIATAFLIRAGQRLAGPTAGYLAGLAYATSSYVLYFTLEVRGYGLLLMLEAAFVEIFLRWLKRPTLVHSLLLLAVQIGLLYTHFISGVVIGLSFLYLLLRAPRRLWPWLVIAAVTGLTFLPMLPQVQRSNELRAALGGSVLPSYFTRELGTFFQAFSAHQDLLCAVIAVLALIGLTRGKVDWRTLLWLAVWGIATPLVAYIIRERSALFTPRYLSFTLPAIFLLVSAGLAALPRYGMWAAAVLLLALALVPWQPYDHRPAPSDDGAPVHQFVRTMAQRWQPGDLLVIDPNFAQFGGLARAYYEQLYFPFVRMPEGSNGRRVWYLVRQGSEDPPTAERVKQGRLRTENFWGPWYFNATLYEGPPLNDGILFGETLRYHGVDIERRSALHAGDSIGLILWWTVDHPIPPELSMSIQLLGPKGQVVAQIDGFPKTPGTPEQLDAWRPGTLHLDKRQIQVPERLPEGNYTLQLIVYRWQDGTRLAPSQDATPDKTLIIDRVQLYSFGAW